jgi:hypothetical protein
VSFQNVTRWKSSGDTGSSRTSAAIVAAHDRAVGDADGRSRCCTVHASHHMPRTPTQAWTRRSAAMSPPSAIRPASTRDITGGYQLWYCPVLAWRYWSTESGVRMPG